MFILNQISDSYTKTTGQIVLKAFLWLICLTAVGIAIRIACIAIYKANGINPMEITNFLGDPSTYVGHATWNIILSILFVAPVCEELIFRLGLGFTRKVDALWVGILPVLIVSFFLKCKTWYIILALLIIGVALYFLVCCFTTDDQWKVWKEKYLKYAVWISALAFGLVHLIAFSTINLQVCKKQIKLLQF